jgi:hypothetical protein
MSRPAVEQLLANKQYKKLRESYDDRFPPTPWFIRWMRDKPTAWEFDEWWQDYITESVIRQNHLRDGWLSGTNYGDY